MVICVDSLWQIAGQCTRVMLYREAQVWRTFFLLKRDNKRICPCLGLTDERQKR